MVQVIGRVSATEKHPSTCNTLRFWVSEEVLIRPFDIVRVQHVSKVSQRPSYTYAIIQELEYITDSPGHLANYIASDFGDVKASPFNPRIGTTIAHAQVLYNDQEIELPVRDNAPVEWADAEGIREALGIKAYRQPIPAGYLCMSNGEEVPIELEAEYLIGPEGAHINVSGISGLATKTSYLMFLLNAIQQRLPERVSMIIFNVKGSDLLFIDCENPELTDEQKSEWEKCGLEARPFSNVVYLLPYADKENNGYTLSHVDADRLRDRQKQGLAMNYYFDVQSSIRKLALLFSDIDDPNSTMESIAHKVQEFEVKSWEELRKHVMEYTKSGSGKDKEISVLSWRKFARLLSTRTAHDLFTEPSRTRVEERCQRTIREAIFNLRPGDVLVIDIEPLPDYLQCFVVGDVIQTIYGIKLGDFEEVDRDAIGTVVIFADELNKYAPKISAGRRTLTDNLLEITERGRSLGMVLFGAEQFRSGVHDRILGNCSTNVFGRTSPVEIEKCPDYRYFPEAYKSTLTRLPQGSLLIQHAVFKTSLLKVKFPRPAYFQPRSGVPKLSNLSFSGEK